MMEALENFVKSLLAVTPAVYHDDAAPDHPDQYIVWGIDGGDAYYADNTAAETSLTITVDLFTALEFDPLVDQLQALYNENQVPWYLNSVQYERDTGLTHWEWVIDVG